jgi:multicomponent Na+:H+ antiporter subunit D
MGAGAVLHSTGRSKLTELGGILKAQPIIFALYMIGAFSISGFPLFNGFISKSMVISAADDAGLTWAYLLLTVASVGTFLHTGLKLPYFTWLGPQRNITPGPVPGNMYMAMGIAAFLCFFLGVLPGTLYRLLPFVADFHPYTAAHLMESVQILSFTGIAFYFFIPKLGGEPTISLDTDWFYRKGGRLFYGFMDKALNGINALSNRFLVRAFSARLGQWSRVPVTSLVILYMKIAGRDTLEIKQSPDEPKPETDNLIPLGVPVFLSFIGLFFVFILLFIALV